MSLVVGVSGIHHAGYPARPDRVCVLSINHTQETQTDRLYTCDPPTLVGCGALVVSRQVAPTRAGQCLG
jgi:hypothetical protein